ncbi:182 kDa tankyrase-1-binding protein isoform X3 [Falco cherrug]|uniref:182 kDa tankyrase-1-binding protein isoform X3 n=1 Tax=Falco cherrug TaxID=345164 RepID=UPI00247AC68A|nr:182 kDa tankyrase-1-binding protein isoform X3 [Falco cherrug]
MASQPQPLCPALPCASATGSGGAGLVAGSPEKGTTRPKPPVRPKPRVLPKPAMPVKPSLPHPQLGPRHPRPALPSAEKMNRLAGPQPYGGSSSGGPLRRPSFTLKSPETPNGKGLPSPLVAAVEDPGLTPSEEVPPTPPTPSRKGPAPFKVTPVPVATKPERFPGTTVEEILAKMDSREGPGSPDRSRLSFFCPDPSSRFGSKTFTAFRRRPSGEADGAPSSEACQTPQPAVGKLGVGDDGHQTAEISSPPASLSCAGDPRGRRRPPSPPDVSSRLALLCRGGSAPGLSPSGLSCLLRGSLSAGSPLSSWVPSAPLGPQGPPPARLRGLLSSLLSPPPRLPALLMPPQSSQPPAPRRWPLAPPNPRLGLQPRFRLPPSRPRVLPPLRPSPGSAPPVPLAPPTLPERDPLILPAPPALPNCPPEPPAPLALLRLLLSTQLPPAPPPELPAKASRPPGSPEGPDDSPLSPQSSEGPEFSPSPPSRDSGLRRSSEGVLQPPTAGQGMGELGGSLSALPRPGDPLSEPSLGSDSGWSLSQSFEWTFPLRGARRLASPPRSPIRETPDSGLSEEGESDGEDQGPCAPCSRGDSGSEEPGPVVAGSRAAEGASCPGGPVAQCEAEGSAEEEEEGEAERDTTVPCSTLCVTELVQDPAERKPPTQPSLPIEATPPDLAPPDPATAAHSVWVPAGDCPVNLQGPGGPRQAEGSSRVPDPHADPGWLTELLASPGPHAAGHGSPDAERPENLLGWSQKDLCSEFGIGRPHQAGTFDWTREAVARERDWPGEVERDREFGARSSWDSTRDGDRQDGPFGTARKDWGSDYKGTELMGEMRLSCSDWSNSHGMVEGCLQDQDFGAGKPKWGTGYGLGSASSREEMGPGKADWSSSYGVGHGQQRDEEPSSRQPSWAGRYGSGDPESQDSEIAPAWAGGYGTGDVAMDRELTPDWASKYSSRDAETKDKDFTLGWAGRSSTGGAATPDKEFGPGRQGWESKYSTRDMESQDREFSPSRPAWTSEYSTQEMESQDQEFSPSRPAWTGEYSTQEMESQDQEFSPSRPAWTGEYSTQEMESQDQEFSPSRPAEAGEYSTRDMESQDREFSPSRPAWTGEYSTQEMESQDREFSPSRLAEANEYSTRDVETQDEEFSPSRPAWASEYSSREVETQDSRFGLSRPAWDDEHGTGNMDTQDGEFSLSRTAWASEYSSADSKEEEREFSPGRLSWAGEHGIGQTDLADAFGVRKDDLPGSHVPEPPAQEPGWGSTHQQERSATDGRDWAEELGGAECHNQFGIIGTERVSGPSGTGASSDGLMSWAGGMRSGGLQEPLGDWHRDLSFSSSDATGCLGTGDAGGVVLGHTAWDQGLGNLPALDGSAQSREARLEEPGWSRDFDAAGWSVELHDAEAKRQEWVSAFGARCAARSRSFGVGEQRPGDGAASADSRSIRLSDPSPPLNDAPADPQLWSPVRVSRPALLGRRETPMRWLLPCRAPGPPLCCWRLLVEPCQIRRAKKPPWTTQMGRDQQAGRRSGSPWAPLSLRDPQTMLGRNSPFWRTWRSWTAACTAARPTWVASAGTGHRPFALGPPRKGTAGFSGTPQSPVQPPQ